MRAFWLPVLVMLCLGLAPATWPQQRIDLPSCPGVTQPIYLFPARTPVASAILYPGGSGAVNAVRSNFLIRVAGMFAAAGVTAAVADAPSDHSWGLDLGVRATEAQAADAAAIVAFLRKNATVPVWLIGTSNGSISAANAAVRLGPSSIAGVVLTSSVWAGGMSMVPVSTLRVPVLVVHNRNDSCEVQPVRSGRASVRDAHSGTGEAVSRGGQFVLTRQSVRRHVAARLPWHRRPGGPANRRLDQNALTVPG